MNTIDLKTVMNKQFGHCAELLMKKGEEYAEDSPDRLEHFKAAAALMGVTPQAALMGMLSKHLVSVSDMCMSGRHYNRDRWHEKLTDSINYLVLLAAIIAEEAGEEAGEETEGPVQYEIRLDGAIAKDLKEAIL